MVFLGEKSPREGIIEPIFRPKTTTNFSLRTGKKEGEKTVYSVSGKSKNIMGKTPPLF